MFIQTEHTPNPATLKFIPGRSVHPSGTADFATRASADASPLASALFEIDGVSGVFFGSDFVTVSKSDQASEWQVLKAPVLATLMQYFTSGAPLFHDVNVVTDTATSIGAGDDPADTDIIIQIKDLIDAKVRPAVARDGGDIVYQGFRQGVVYLHMQGSCAGCPSSTATLKGGIESLLKHYVPEVTEVRAI